MARKSTKKTQEKKINPAEVLGKETIDRLALSGRAVLGKPLARAPEKVVEDFRYVYNPHTYQVIISSLGIAVRPGEVVDLEKVVVDKDRLAAAKASDLSSAVARGVLYGFKYIEDLANVAIPDSKPPIEELKETAIPVDETGIERSVKEVVPEDNPFEEALLEDYAKEEKALENITKKARRRK